MIAALYVQRGGVYWDLPNVDPWDEERDARNYAGPYPVVAHPPCQRWGRYWSGGPSARVRRHKGDDRGMFAQALWAVRTFGGVLEHPEASHAWAWYGLRRPPRHGGWMRADEYGGLTCCVEQGWYDHPARKLTWLYYSGGKPPHELKWGRAPGQFTRLDEGFHSKEERARKIRAGAQSRLSRLSRLQREATPVAFRDELIRLAEWSSS